MSTSTPQGGAGGSPTAPQGGGSGGRSAASAAAAGRTMTLPQGVDIASYATYLEAQRAVDHLSDEGFPVQHTSIVGTDLRSVEKVLGRLTYPRVALRGALSGAWFGLFVGLLLTFFSTAASGATPVVALLIGAAFGMLWGVIGFASTRGQRDFTAVNAIMASRYTVLCSQEVPRAQALLAHLEGVRPLAPESS